MFTGLVQSLGTVRQIVTSAESKRLVISAELGQRDRALGASVAVSGVCLTVTGASATHFEADAAFETLRRTRLDALRPGSRVNLEPALRMGDALGGHLVSGHVDGLGHLSRIEARGEARNMVFSMPRELAGYVAEKGSICIDGVSLTVNAVDENSFSVGLIPHTLAVTTLGERREGDAVNLEVDLLARYVARLLQVPPPGMDGVQSSAQDRGRGVTMDSLVRSGFPGTDELKGRT